MRTGESQPDAEFFICFPFFLHDTMPLLKTGNAFPPFARLQVDDLEGAVLESCHEESFAF
jgi:hypothetical protein